MWARSRARADRGNRFLFARLGLVIPSATFGSFGQLLHLLTLHDLVPFITRYRLPTYSITPRDSFFQHFTASMDWLWNLRSHLSPDMENKRKETIDQVWFSEGRPVLDPRVDKCVNLAAYPFQPRPLQIRCFHSTLLSTPHRASPA